MSEAGQMGMESHGFCRTCGTALTGSTRREVRGMLYCEGCLAQLVETPKPAPGSGSPGLAAALGLVPGLGAVYNGEYLKALVHVLIFGGIVSILSSGRAGGWEPLFALSMAGFIVYMSVDAYRCAQARLRGEKPAAAFDTANKPVGPYILIGLGVLLLLRNFDWFPVEQLFDYLWPVALIALGIFLLRSRLSSGRPTEGNQP